MSCGYGGGMSGASIHFIQGMARRLRNALGYDIDSDQFVIFGGSGKFGV